MSKFCPPSSSTSVDLELKSTFVRKNHNYQNCYSDERYTMPLFFACALHSLVAPFAAQILNNYCESESEPQSILTPTLILFLHILWEFVVQIITDEKQQVVRPVCCHSRQRFLSTKFPTPHLRLPFPKSSQIIIQCSLRYVCYFT